MSKSLTKKEMESKIADLLYFMEEEYYIGNFISEEKRLQFIALYNIYTSKHYKTEKTRYQIIRTKYNEGYDTFLTFIRSLDHLN